ncbi:unnamed protein product [Echinostoma caproni]|uniref:Uncharacterized protein n=1 Tax=Echinostoma caproni TaxID=27848 RepID=A0A183AYQ0_9TREM|nr:unnamed protein product [Echinostoma caproni]
MDGSEKPPRLYSTGDQALECSNQYGTGTSTPRNNTGLLTRFSTSSGVTRQSPIGNSLGPRVTFKENVDTIANVSPNVSDPGSQNTSSNDSGIDNLKPTEVKVPPPMNGNNTDSSGTYDNAFTPTVRSSLVIRSPSQTMGNRNDLVTETSGSGTLPRVLAPSSTFASSSNQVMNTSIYSNRLPTYAVHGQNSEHTPLLVESTESDLANLLKPPNLSLNTTRLGRPNEMIGDGASSLQSSSTADQYPMLLSSSPSCLLGDETHEPRLCSQV